MKELGNYIKVKYGRRCIMIRGQIEKGGINVEVDMPCPFKHANCTEDCELLKFEQISSAYAENEFDVTFGCIDSLYCSLYVED